LTFPPLPIHGPSRCSLIGGSGSCFWRSTPRLAPS